MECGKRFRCLLLLCAVFPGNGVISMDGAGDTPSLSASAWKEDLDFLARKLPEVHKNLFFKLPRKDFDAHVQRIGESLPGMSDLDARVALTKLMASIGDSHTKINALRSSAFYPIRFRSFPEGFFVTAAREEYRRAIGARLVGVGDFDIDEVHKRLLPLVSLENYLMAVINVPHLLYMADALCGTHILSGTDEGTFRFEKDGQPFALAIRSLPADQQGDLLDRPDKTAYESPLYLSGRAWYWFRYLSDARVLYIQYNTCAEMKSLSFVDFTSQVMRAADDNPVKKVVLDLRHNMGGNTEVIQPLFAALKTRLALTRKGNLFVLTSNFTYSSAFMNSLQIKRQLGAKMVGEPSAQKPNCYGHTRAFQLPNSGLTIDYSTQYFSMAPGNPEFIVPDVLVKLTARDYFSGRDPVLEWVLNR